MSLKVKFDRILGRLREADVETPTPPAPSHTFTATTSGSNKTYYADEKETDTLTVTVTLRYDGNPVDADTNGVPSGWEKVPNTIGQYSKTISGSGSTGNGTFSYTANGETKTASAQSKTLTKKWPAYWGVYPSGTRSEDRHDSGQPCRATPRDLQRRQPCGERWEPEGRRLALGGDARRGNRGRC